MKRRRRRRLLRAAIVLLLLAAAVWFAVPALLESSWGRRRIEAALGGSLAEPVRIERLDFGWTRGFVVEGLSAGDGALTVERIDATPDLLSLLTDEPDVGEVEARGVEVLVVREEDGTVTVPALARRKSRRRPGGRSSGPRESRDPVRLHGDVRVAPLVVRLADGTGEARGRVVLEPAVELRGGEVRIEATGEGRGIVWGDFAPATVRLAFLARVGLGRRRVEVERAWAETARAGFRAKGAVDASADPPLVDLEVEGSCDLSRVPASVLPDGVRLSGAGEGHARLEGTFDPADPLSGLTAGGGFRFGHARAEGYHLEKGSVRFALRGRRLEIEEGAARLNGGPVEFRGVADLAEGPPALDLDLSGSDVGLAATMEPEVRYLAPIFGRAAEISGRLGLTGEVSLRGRSRSEILESLTGTVGIEVADGRVAGSPAATALLRWLDRDPALPFAKLSGRLRFGGGEVVTEDLVLTAGKYDIRFRGRTTMGGEIDYRIGVRAPEGSRTARRFRVVADDEGWLPLGLAGTLSAPRLTPPDVREAAENALQELLRRALDRDDGGGKKGKKDDRGK